jgi:DNA-damage-inducible protein J
LFESPIAIEAISFCSYTVATWKGVEMAHDSVVRARIDEKTKRQAAKVFAECGITISDAIRIMLLRTAKEKEIPFSIHVPNKKTIAAIRELEKNGGRGKKYKDFEALLKDLNA